MDPTTSKPRGELVGQRLGRFVVLARLGEGGMGVVYRAEDTRLQRPVALKVLSPDIARQADLRARFLREARALAAVNDPHIAAVYEAAETDDGVAYLVMELVKGQTLRHLLDAQRLAPARAITLATEISSGLAAAHQAGVVHRDLKPENVMVTPEGTAKLLDFGVAQQRGPQDGLTDVLDRAGATINGQLLGTPGYMAPEQAMGREVDHRADLFAVGVILFEMLTSQRPFGGDTTMERVMAVVNQVPTPVRTLDAKLSPELERLVQSCLARDPASRPQSAAALVAALAALSAPGANTLPPIVVDHREPCGGRRQAGRGRRGLLMGVGLLAGLGLAVAWGAVRHRARTRPTPVTALPIPTRVPAARRAFAAALQALHDGDWLAARDQLLAAGHADPEFAAVPLRLALLDFALPHRLKEARQQLRRAVRQRRALSERDGLLLPAVVALVERDPPDHRAAADHLADATARFPGDAELHFLRAWVLQRADWKGALEAARRAADIDPSYSDALQIESSALAALGRTAEAMKPLGQCVETAPSPGDCLLARIDLDTWNGACAQAERDARQVNARAGTAWVYGPWAEAMLAQGRPRPAVEAVLAQQLPHVAAAHRAEEAARQQAELALYDGRFDRAAELAADARSMLPTDTGFGPRSDFARIQVEALMESGALERAADVAADFLARADAWTHGADQRDRDVTPRLWQVLARAGRMGADELAAKRRAYLSAVPGTLGLTAAGRWDSAFGEVARTADDARRALAAIPANGLPQYQEYGLSVADRARIERLAGNAERALPVLRRASASCRVLDDPLRWVHLHAELGQALEAMGNAAGACAAYGVVLTRWGRAPHSITVDLARARRTALHCK